MGLKGLLSQQLQDLLEQHRPPAPARHLPRASCSLPSNQALVSWRTQAGGKYLGKILPKSSPLSPRGGLWVTVIKTPGHKTQLHFHQK